MLTQLEYLLVKVGEECGELQQVASKANLFGIDDLHPVTGISNRESFIAEMHDVIETAKLALENVGQEFKIEQSRLSAKRAKIYLYMLQSYYLGRVAIPESEFDDIVTLASSRLAEPVVMDNLEHLRPLCRANASSAIVILQEHIHAGDDVHEFFIPALKQLALS